MKFGSDRIYYERRVKQYLNNNLVKPYQKFGLKIITQSFVAMFLEEVHQTHRHETFLIKNFNGKIFEDNHSFYSYYTSTFAYFKLEDLIKKRKLNIGKLNSYRFHILLISKYISHMEFVKKDFVYEMISDDFCKSYLNMISIDAQAEQIFKKSIDFMNEAIKHWMIELKKSKFSIRDNKEFTDILLGLLKQNFSSENKSIEAIQGYVNNVILKGGRYFGFITYGNSKTIYFDSRSIMGNEKLDSSWKGKKVSFEIGIDSKGKSCAKNVKLI